MPSYLLSCSCGQQTRVSSVQAGETLRCGCGLPLSVPSMRELRSLPLAADGPARKVASWENRHRAAFVLVLVAIGALATAGYLAAQLPPPELQVTPQAVDEWVRTSTADEALGMFEDLKKGLQPDSSNSAETESSRKRLLWGVGVALSLCIVALVGAAIALRRRAPRTFARH